MQCAPKEWIAVSQVPGLGNVTLAKLIKDGYTPDQILRNELPAGLGIRTKVREFLASHQTEELLVSAQKSIDRALKQDIHLLTLDDTNYPALLKEIPDPPCVLWYKGNTSLLSIPQIAIVGSRKPTPGGKNTAFEFAKSLGKAGFTVTSGLALGIDTQAHQGVVSEKMACIAVLGSGLDKIYPNVNRALAEEILACNGLLIAEVLPGTPPLKENFPKRNRIISGLSVGTLVVEAAIRSGSLITARQAMEQGREVFAIPGSLHNPLAKGCHHLIREGATLVQTVFDITTPLASLLGYISGSIASDKPLQGTLKAREEDEQLLNHPIYAHLLSGAMNFDDLLSVTGLNGLELQNQLVLAEMDGKIMRTGHQYSLL